MISSEVQRTLVKSPPELWAELSDPDALSRHLGELGEIRIVRVEAESTVEWAAENTTGTVSIKPSGWGTKVTLRVTRELAEQATPESSAGEQTAEEAEAKGETETEPADVPAPESTALDAAPEAEPETEPTPEMAPTSETATATEPESAPAPTPVSEAAAAPEPRRGFFARLFGRRPKTLPSATREPASAVAQPSDPPAQTAMAEQSPAQPDAFAAVRQALEPGTFAAEHPFAAVPEVKQPAAAPPVTDPVPDADPQQTGDIAAELLAAEEAGAEEVTAVLTAVLDRLGAAHHRPFSRS